MADKPVKNFPLLWKTYDYIADHPEQWSQHIWALKTDDCGTSHCFAGWAVSLTQEAAPLWGQSLNAPDWERTYAWYFESHDGETISYSDAARTELGLTYEEAESLFFTENTLGRIHDLISNWEREDTESWLALH